MCQSGQEYKINFIPIGTQISLTNIDQTCYSWKATEKTGVATSVKWDATSFKCVSCFKTVYNLKREYSGNADLKIKKFLNKFNPIFYTKFEKKGSKIMFQGFDAEWYGIQLQVF